MNRSLIFVSSVADAMTALRIIRRNHLAGATIIGNHPLALLFLKKHGIDAIDSQRYFSTAGRSINDYQKIVNQSKLLKRIPKIKNRLRYRRYYFGDILDFGLNFFLSEVNHSLLAAAEILNVEKPDVIYVSPEFSESPMKKYQSGNLNCENRALYEVARAQNIRVIPICHHRISESARNIIISVHWFTRALMYSIRQLTVKNRPFRLPPLVILANYYQLTNLLPLTSAAQTNRLPFVVLTKALKEQLAVLEEKKIPYFSFESPPPIRPKINELRIFLFLKYFILWLWQYPSLRREFNRPGEWQLIKWKMFYYYLVQIPELIEWLYFADQLFGRRPKLLLTTATTDFFSKCIALSARKHRIPIIELLHGFLIFDEESSFRCNDIYGIWGPAILPLLDQRATPQHTLITGYPYKLSFPKPPEIKTLAKRGRMGLGIGKSDKILLVLAAFPVSVTRFFSTNSGFGFINTVIAGIEATGNRWTVVIRPHPSNNPDWIDKLPTHSRITLKLDIRQQPLDQLVAASDYVIANHTTALLEPLAQRKPLFFYSFPHPDCYPYSSHPLIISGAAQTFQTAKELTGLLMTNPTIISSKQRRNILKFLKEYCSLPAAIPFEETLIPLLRQFL